MIKLTSFGCSFIFGTDLPDTNNDQIPSKLVWPALLAKKFGLEYNTWSCGARGNLMIMDRVIDEACNPKSAADTLFVIQWTYIDRYDYCDPSGRRSAIGQGNDYLTLLPQDHSSTAEFYYKHLHSEYRDKITNIGYIKNALDCLLEHRCKFVMTALDDLIWCKKFNTSRGMRYWQDHIKIHTSFFDGENFQQWSQRQGFDISSQGHPLEDAHQAAAELMTPAIDAILHRA